MTDNVLEFITAVRRKGLMIHEPEEEEEGRSSRKQGHSEQEPHQHTIRWMMGVSSVYYLPKALPEMWDVVHLSKTLQQTELQPECGHFFLSCRLRR